MMKSSTSRADLKSAMYKTVEIFARLTERKLWLKDGSWAQTNGYEIVVPFDRDDAYLLLEHELSHIVFKSDAHAVRAFIARYAPLVNAAAKKQGVSIPQGEINAFVNSIVQILEDHRVNSLWSVLYPGSYKRMLGFDRAFLKKKAYSSPTSSLLDYFCWVEVGLEPPQCRFDTYRATLQAALNNVWKRGMKATLITAKWLVVKLVDGIIEQLAPKPRKGAKESGGEGDVRQRAEALRLLISSAGRMSQPAAQKYNDTIASDHLSNKDKDEADRFAEAAIQVSKQDMEEEIEKSTAEMRRIIGAVKKVLGKPTSEDEQLRRNALAKVVFKDVKKKDLEEPEMTKDRAAQLQKQAEAGEHLSTGLLLRSAQILEREAEDAMVVRRLRAMFYRVMGLRRIALTDTGSEIDVQAYLERLSTGEPVPCFRETERGRGFRTLVLMDRSASMRGNKTEQTERACGILQRALQFPFVDLSVWGFQQLFEGEAIITRYERGLESFGTGKKDVDGGTPLHVASRIVLQHLERGNDVKQAFFITDGAPYYILRSGEPQDPVLMIRWIRESILRARNRGIGVTGVMIGHQRKDGSVAYEVNREVMGFMFGHDRNWRRLRPATLADDLIKLVSSSFLTYLRHA